MQKINETIAHLSKISSADTRSITLAILFTALISSLIIGIFDIHRILMIVLSTVFILALIFTYIGYCSLGSWVAILASFLIHSFIAFTSDGIRDSIMMGFIIILLAAGLLAGKTGTVIFGILIILEIGVYGELESRGIIPGKVETAKVFLDYMLLCMAVALITLLQWLVISRLRDTIEHAEQELKNREKIQTQLQEAEARYRGLVESIPLVIYISEPGKGGAWQFVSPQITKLTGYAPEEWTSNPHLWYSLIHPDDRERVVAEESAVLLEDKMPNLEYRLLTRNKGYIWVYDESLIVVESKNRLVQGFLLDITKRKSAEEQLQNRIIELQTVHDVSEKLNQQTELKNLIHETGEQIRLSLMANNVLIAIHNPSTNLIHFPYDYEDGVLRKDAPIRYGTGMTTRIMEMKKPVIIDKDWVEKAGELNVIYTLSVPVKSSVSVPIMTSEQVFGVITLESTSREYAFGENDVRLLSTISSNLAVAIEKTRLQESLNQELGIQERLIRELEIKNEELERFTYTASHDLKSPLITIRGFLNYLEKDALAGNLDRLRQDIKQVSNATEKMHSLLTDLLHLSRVGRAVNTLQDIPFKELVTDALQRVQGQLTERRVSVQVANTFPVVQVDRERIIEVIQNLVDNACKFMGSQLTPTIEIGYEESAGQAVFFVRDNGIGIKKEFSKKIFGLFDKLNPDSEGSGVGLALVKRIVEVHGGKIWVESEEGAGATFYFTLGSKS